VILPPDVDGLLQHPRKQFRRALERAVDWWEGVPT